MAAKTLSEELLSCVSPYSYASLIPCLNTDDYVNLRNFPKTELGQMFTIDRSNCKKDGKINYSHLFETLENSATMTLTRLELIRWTEYTVVPMFTKK